jgi:hypothetical protein
MIQMMMATMGGTPAARNAQKQHASMLRKAVGFAIVASGFAVIAGEALQRVFGG